MGVEVGVIKGHKIGGKGRYNLGLADYRPWIPNITYNWKIHNIPYNPNKAEINP